MSAQRPLFTARLFLFSAAYLAAPAAGHEPLVAPAKSAPAKSPIALIDLKYIFDHYDHFQQQKDKVTAEVELAEAAVKLRTASYVKLKKDLDKATPGTPLHAELERTLTQEEADLKAFVALQRRTFLRREAKLYLDMYREVLAEVEAYMAEREILVVLRYNRDLLKNAGDVKEVAQHLNKPVVACNSKIDITQAILDRVREKQRVRVTGRTKK